MSERDIAAERIRLLRENAKHVGVSLATEHDIYWVCDKLTAAQSRVEELEREIKALELACDKQREARKRVERQNELVGEDIVILSRTRVAAERERDEAKSVNVLLTADNQRLRELLRECLPIVRHSVDERFNVELPKYQNRLQLRDRIKAAIGDK